jgi:hypothetical protein
LSRVTELLAVRPDIRGGDVGSVPLCSIALRGVRLATRNGPEALEALERVSERLHAVGDPRGAFPEVYGVITRRVLLELRKPYPGFLEPAWIDELMGRFCARYLETLGWSMRGLPQDCEAWRLAYEYAAAELTIPMQDVLFGISAHVNHDLALDTARAILARGHAHDPVMLIRYKHDFDYINALLREMMPECMARVRDRYGCRAAGAMWAAARPLVERGFLAGLAAWRERVWADVRRLLAAEDEVGRAAVRRAIDRRAGLIGQVIAGLSAGWVVGRAVLPRRAHRALRNLVIAERAAGDFRRLGDLGAAGVARRAAALEACR